VHRDVKPSNVWLETPQADRAKLLDFGLARAAEEEASMTQSGMVVGTPAYMSPEQADGMPLDGRSDLFSLGCVLYELATGAQPFSRETTLATLRAVAYHEPPPPHEIATQIPRPLSDLIGRLLAKAPADRPASAQVTAEALQQMAGGGTTVPSTTTPVSVSPPRTRRRLLYIAAGVLLLGLTSLGAYLGWLRMGQHPIEARVDIHFWRGPDGVAVRRRLSDNEALPLLAGDKVRIEAAVTPEAYLYLFWIDTEGTVNPIYPWQPGKWNTRPDVEQPRASLEMPFHAEKGFTITGQEAGMETLLLLARSTPLQASDDEVQRWFTGLPAQRPAQNPRAAVWFENSRIVDTDPLRRALLFEEGEINDPVLRLQALLRERLQPHAQSTAAVSFAKQGKP
jgi:hypothetical protein